MRPFLFSLHPLFNSVCAASSGEPVKPYKINDKTVNQALELKHGASQRAWNMDKVSNGPFVEVGIPKLLIPYALTFSQKEFERLVRVCATEKVKLPSKRQLEQQVSKMHKLTTQPMTEVWIGVLRVRIYLTPW